MAHVFDSFDELLTDTTLDDALDAHQVDMYAGFFDDFQFNYRQIPEGEIIYVSGYVSFQMKQKVSCDVCVTMFASDEPIENKYFEDINRGGLSVPSNLCITLGLLANQIMQDLISEKYESVFVKSRNHRRVLMFLLEEALFFFDNVDDECTICRSIPRPKYLQAFKIFSNILLNNYRKCKSDAIDSMKSTPSEKKVHVKAVGKENRKLNTLK